MEVQVSVSLNYFTKPKGSGYPCLIPDSLLLSVGRVRPEVVSVVGQAGGSAVLGCDLLPPSGRPPLHVIEWLRFGFLLPIFIQFGLYSPRIDPDYVGKTFPQQAFGVASQKGCGGQGTISCSVLSCSCLAPLPALCVFHGLPAPAHTDRHAHMDRHATFSLWVCPSIEGALQGHAHRCTRMHTHLLTLLSVALCDPFCRLIPTVHPNSLPDLSLC